MGQAAVDLPDPLNPPAASAASTDDLLAQLAGEEIDRMLAESEREAAAAPRLIPPTPQPPPTTPSISPIKSAAAVPDTDESAAAELDAILGKAQADTSHDPVEAIASLGKVSKVAPKSVASAEPFDEDDLLAAERGALKVDETPQSLAERIEASAEADQPLPSLLFRALGWLNAPLDACSDNAREIVGKIAILTTVNALAVLAYVLFLRKHG